MTFMRENTVKAVRKPAHCWSCAGMIEVGQPAVRYAGISDGEFVAAAYHVECRTAEVAFNELRGTYGDEWGGLDEMEREDHEWLIAEHPIAAAHMGIVAP
jgi:hypothetical protein